MNGSTYNMTGQAPKIFNRAIVKMCDMKTNSISKGLYLGNCLQIFSYLPWMRKSDLVMSEYEIQAEKIWMPPSRMKSINALISTLQSLALPIFANYVFHFMGMIQQASDFNEWVDL